jgi:predicted nucleic acid-binding protein
MMIRTYVDANLLITAFRGNDAGVAAAIQILDDARRVWVSSAFLRLEILRKPLFYQRHDEVRFMEAFFAQVNDWVAIDDALVQQALSLAAQHDLGAMDALHIAAALTGQVEEFVTLEKASKPICRVPGLRVISLHSESLRGEESQ